MRISRDGTAIAKDREGETQESLMEQARTNPILIVAAIAVLLFSLLGAAALSGVLPAGNTKALGAGALPQKAQPSCPA
jgi:hypothetical protein